MYPLFTEIASAQLLNLVVNRMRLLITFQNPDIAIWLMLPIRLGFGAGGHSRRTLERGHLNLIIMSIN